MIWKVVIIIISIIIIVKCIHVYSLLSYDAETTGHCCVVS